MYVLSGSQDWAWKSRRQGCCPCLVLVLTYPCPVCLFWGADYILWYLITTSQAKQKQDATTCMQARKPPMPFYFFLSSAIHNGDALQQEEVANWYLHPSLWQGRRGVGSRLGIPWIRAMRMNPLITPESPTHASASRLHRNQKPASTLRYISPSWITIVCWRKFFYLLKDKRYQIRKKSITQCNAIPLISCIIWQFHFSPPLTFSVFTPFNHPAYFRRPSSSLKISHLRKKKLSGGR